MRQVVMLLGWVIAVTPVAAQTTPEQVANRFHALQAEGDSLGSLELLVPDVVIFESGGVERSRAEYRAHHLGVDVQFAAATEREVVEQDAYAEGDIAWVLTRTRVRGTFRGREIDSRGAETMVMRRTPEGWRIVHIHWSSRRAG